MFYLSIKIVVYIYIVKELSEILISCGNNSQSNLYFVKSTTNLSSSASKSYLLGPRRRLNLWCLGKRILDVTHFAATSGWFWAARFRPWRMTLMINWLARVPKFKGTRSLRRTQVRWRPHLRLLMASPKMYGLARRADPLPPPDIVDLPRCIICGLPPTFLYATGATFTHARSSPPTQRSELIHFDFGLQYSKIALTWFWFSGY
jgi:hypothetical protein